jgi:uncharacterized protein (DUF2147 family)
MNGRKPGGQRGVKHGVTREPAMMRISIAVTAIAAMLVLAAPALAASPLEGHWTNPQENVVVHIAPCGSALCGRAISGSPRAKAKAIRSGAGNLIGAALMKDLVPAGAGQWTGSMFVPDRNIHAPGTIRMIDANRIKVSGCVWGFICKSQVWKRVG